MALHRLPHVLHILRVQRVVHQLQVVLGPNAVEDEQADVESTSLHVVALAMDVEAHPAHDDLESAGIDLGEGSTEIGKDASEHLDGYFCDLHILVDTELCYDYID